MEIIRSQRHWGQKETISGDWVAVSYEQKNSKTFLTQHGDCENCYGLDYPSQKFEKENFERFCYKELINIGGDKYVQIDLSIT